MLTVSSLLRSAIQGARRREANFRTGLRIQYEQAPKLAARSGRLAAELIDGLLQASLGPKPKIHRDHRATRERLTEAFRAGWNPLNVQFAGYLSAVGCAVFGSKHDWDKETARQARRSRELARGLADASKRWNEEMLWVFLHACLLRTKTGDSLDRKAIKARPWIADVVASLAPPEKGPGAELYAKVARSMGVKVATAPSGSPSLPRKLPSALKDVAALVDSLGLTQKELPRRAGASARGVKNAAKALGKPLPRSLGELYRRWDGLGAGNPVRIARVPQLAALNRSFAEWRERVGAKPRPELIAFGTFEGSANFLFLEPKRETVFLFDHADDSRRRYAKSVAALVASLALGALEVRDPTNRQLGALLKQAR